MAKELTIYRKKIKHNDEVYAYFFIPKEQQEDFANFTSLTIECNDGTKYYNVKIYKSGDYKNLRFFIFANDFFNDHKRLKEKGVNTKEKIRYSIEGETLKIDIPQGFHVDNLSKQTISPEITSIDKVVISNDEPQKLIEPKQIEYDEAFKNKIIELLGDGDEYGLLKVFKENEWCFRASEENVRVELIDPVLKVLGWSIPYLRREDHNRDYVLCREKYASKDSIQIIIEAKKYQEQLFMGDNEKADVKDNEQLYDYLDRAGINFGILTNGIRWCLFHKRDYLGEIDITKSELNDICKFFKLISFDFIKKNEIRTFDLSFIPENNEDSTPSVIIIDGEEYTSQCDACYEIARMSLEKKPEELFDIEFFRDIVFKRTDEDYYLKVSRTNTPYEKDNSKFLIGDYGIYEKLTLLQEINSTLDLGLTITAE